MANRYRNIKSKKLDDGRKVYPPKIYPNIPKSDQDLFVVTQTGDRYDNLANQFYGDSSLWWIITSANNVHDAPIGIKEGTILRIPQNYQKIIKDFES